MLYSPTRETKRQMTEPTPATRMYATRFLRRPRSYFVLVGFAFVLGCAGSRPPIDEFELDSRQRDAALKALLGEEDYLEYVTITDTLEADEWLRRFWIRHDPTPTTVENEFEEEHRRRVYHAIRFFGNPRRGGPPWDDRGEVYIRYGEPNERRILQHGMAEDPFHNTASPGYSPDGGQDILSDARAATEVWTYYRYNQTFQFEDARGIGNFELAPVRDPLTGRQDIAAFYRSRLTAVDLQPAIYFHEYGRNLIDYALDVVRFKADGNFWRIDINLGYPLAELGRGDDSVSISLRRTLIILDDKEREVYGEVGVIRRIVDSLRSQNRLMVEQKVVELPPGRYRLAVTIDDLFSGRTGTYTKDLHLPPYIVAEVQEISDIELASFVWSIYEPDSPFIKGGRMVMPLPSRIYLQDQPLAFYYEVYNLLLDQSGVTRYRVNYLIEQIGGDFKRTIAEPGSFSGAHRTAQQTGSIDLTGVPSGEFVLTISVFDEIGNHEKTTSARFRKAG